MPPVMQQVALIDRLAPPDYAYAELGRNGVEGELRDRTCATPAQPWVARFRHPGQLRASESQAGEEELSRCGARREILGLRAVKVMPLRRGSVGDVRRRCRPGSRHRARHTGEARTTQAVSTVAVAPVRSSW